MRALSSVGAAALFLTCLVSADASALPEYPERLQEAAQTPCLPRCNVCHRDENAGEGTVDRPFARSMEQVGGLAQGSGVADAVAALRAAATDSDGDTVPDIEELAHGDDPNNALEARICGPRVGCAAAARSGGGGLSTLLALALVLALRARRPRREHGAVRTRSGGSRAPAR